MFGPCTAGMLIPGTHPIVSNEHSIILCLVLDWSLSVAATTIQNDNDGV